MLKTSADDGKRFTSDGRFNSLREPLFINGKGVWGKGGEKSPRIEPRRIYFLAFSVFFLRVFSEGAFGRVFFGISWFWGVLWEVTGVPFFSFGTFFLQGLTPSVLNDSTMF